MARIIFGTRLAAEEPVEREWKIKEFCTCAEADPELGDVGRHPGPLSDSPVRRLHDITVRARHLAALSDPHGTGRDDDYPAHHHFSLHIQREAEQKTERLYIEERQDR